MKFSILCPTRERPHNIKPLLDSILNTISDPNGFEIIFRIDDDDLLSQTYFENINLPYVKILSGPCVYPATTRMHNECLKLVTGELILACGDDTCFHTKNWDTMVEEEFLKFNDRILLVYGRDGIQDQRLATHPIVHINWTNTLGHLFPFDFCQWADNWVTDVGRLIGRLKYLPELFIEHVHWCTGKAKLDHIYTRMTSMVQVESTKYTSLDTERRMEASKLLRFMQQFKENECPTG